MIVAGIFFAFLGLGLVIVIHELGHFFAARASGVEVEAFSIGWGPKLFSWKRGATEWRISAIPLGGYCRMKGEEAFAAAIQTKAETIPREPGTFYGAPAWKRIIISVSGPLCNILLAAVIFIAVAAVGTSSKTFVNRIVLASDYPSLDAGLPGNSPAVKAGLKSGDIVLEAGGEPVLDFTDLQGLIQRSPENDLPLVIDRDGQRLELQVTPFLDKESGAGRIGIYPWVPLLVSEVSPGSAAALAGIQPGDKIVTLDGKAISHDIDLRTGLVGQPQKVALGVERNGKVLDLSLVPNWSDRKEGPFIGLSFQLASKVSQSLSLGQAAQAGLAKTASTIEESVRALGLLFRGVNILSAVSGPARITYYAGAIAVDAVKENGPIGIMTYLDFLAFISIALFLMNLLPIPALDGGMIILFIAEILKRSPLRTKTVYAYQLVGTIFIFGLLALALTSDAFHFFPSR